MSNVGMFWPMFNIRSRFPENLLLTYFDLFKFSGFGGLNRFADPQHKSNKFRGIPRKVVEQWQKVQEMDGIITEIMIRTLMKYSQKFAPPTQKANSKNENKERAVWNVGQRLRGNMCVWCVRVCVCVRAHRCMGLGERTAGKPPHVLSCACTRGRPITQKTSRRVN